MAKVKPNTEIETKITRTETLASDVLSALNQKFKKDYKNPLVYLSEASLATSWCPTGSDMLDLAISNRPNGGMPYGFILEIFGPSGTSKSLLAAHLMAACQKQNGLAVLFDTENAVGVLDFYMSIGLDPSKTIYTDKLRAIEDVYDAMESIVLKTLESDPERPVVLVVDSVMGATTHLELESAYEKEGWATAKAIVNSKAMRKLPSLIAGRNILIVLINQVRDNLNAGFGGEQFITSGGKAIGFTASVRLKTKVISRSSKNMEGETVEITVVKNRFGPPRKSVKFEICYDSGIDNYSSWFYALKDFELLKPAGNAGHQYEYVDVETGELVAVKFRESTFGQFIENNPKVKDVIYRHLCDCYILKYKIPNEETTQEPLEE